VVCFSPRHVVISMIFWERRILIQVFTWKVREKVVPELEFEDV